MNSTLPARKGRPCIAHPLTPGERSSRYRANKRAERQQAVIDVLAYLVSEAAKPCDENVEKLWQENFNEQCNLLDEEFEQSWRNFSI